jgi:fused signal recognition particle receptor
MFRFLKKQFSKIYTHVTSKLGSLFASKRVDNETLATLERVLIEADTGVATTKLIMERLRSRVTKGSILEGEDLKEALSQELKELLHACPYTAYGSIYLLVGVNGTGKTTFAAKLAHLYSSQGKKVLIAAADTFRAAASEQLKVWAERAGADFFSGPLNADPASVVFGACQRFATQGYDILIIDTAGRLQNKTNLMRELEKIRKVITRALPPTALPTPQSAHIVTLLTVDALLGQNSLDQAKLFNQATQLSGIVLTKMDGTGKGGTVFAITREIKVPIAYLSYGEGLTDFSSFDPDSYVNQLLG